MFGYPEEMPMDITKGIDFEFRCKNNASEYIIRVCDSTNPTRRFGDVLYEEYAGVLGKQEEAVLDKFINDILTKSTSVPPVAANSGPRH
ncbi:unnamed protein product [Caenorhabditis nigoni]